MTTFRNVHWISNLVKVKADELQYGIKCQNGNHYKSKSTRILNEDSNRFSKCTQEELSTQYYWPINCTTLQHRNNQYYQSLVCTQN